MRIGDFWVEGLRKKRFLFQVLGFVSKMDFGVLMCVLVAMVDVKRWWLWILEYLAVMAGSFVDFSGFVVVVTSGGFDMGFLGSSWWVAVWMVVGLGVLLGL